MKMTFLEQKILSLFLNEIKSREITIEKAKQLQEDFNNYLKKYEEEIKLKSTRKH